MVWPAIIAGAAALAGGAMQANSAKKAANSANANASAATLDSYHFNRMLAEQQREWEGGQAASAMAFESDQAKRMMDYQDVSNAKQMEFQERMSSSAHQREVNDLRAAGLNPILSGTGGMGSSSPVGSSSAGGMARGQKGSSSAGSVSTAQTFKQDVIDIIGPAISSAVTASRVSAEIPKLEAEAVKTGQETVTEKERWKLVKAQTEDYMESAALKETLRTKIPLERDKISSEIADIEAAMHLKGQQALLADAQAQQARGATGKLSEETKALEIDRFVRKQVMDLKESDLKGVLKELPLDFVKGTLLHVLKNKD